MQNANRNSVDNTLYYNLAVCSVVEWQDFVSQNDNDFTKVTFFQMKQHLNTKYISSHVQQQDREKRCI